MIFANIYLGEEQMKPFKHCQKVKISHRDFGKLSGITLHAWTSDLEKFEKVLEQFLVLFPNAHTVSLKGDIEILEILEYIFRNSSTGTELEEQVDSSELIYFYIIVQIE